MMLKEYYIIRSGSKSLLLLPLLTLLTLTFCSKKTEYSDFNPNKTYSDVELHYDSERSEEMGVPFDAQYTPSGELFSGTQKYYYTKNDSLYMELYFEEGINTGSVMYKDGDIYREKHGRYLNGPLTNNIYINGNLSYENVPPTESEDGMGHIRTWHRNGQLGAEVTYTGEQVYQGLMTEYDEEGNIIIQKRYEDGEVVDKEKVSSANKKLE